MILNRFFKPKWQHPDPQVRKLALQSLSTTDPILVQAVREDQNPGVRRAIVHRISDLDLLQQIAREDAEVGVRETADARFRRLMAGQEPDSPSLEVRIAILAQSFSAELAEFLAVHAVEPQLRLAVLDRVEQDALLGEVASHDSVTEIRLAALERIQEDTTLKQLAKQSRKGDKRVNRRVRERLHAIQLEREHALRCEQLCLEMESLADELAGKPNASRFQRLEQAWEAQGAVADTGLQERYRQARERFLDRLHKSTTTRKQRVAIYHALEHLLERLQVAVELSPELAAMIQTTLQTTRRDWVACGVAGETEQQRFCQLSEVIKDRERILRHNSERAERLRQHVRQADVLLHQASEVRERDLIALQQRWGSLECPEAQALIVDLQAQFDAALSRLRGRLQRQLELRDQEREEIQNLITALEQALAQGLLQQAILLYEQARQRLQHNIGLSRSQMTALEERLQACAPRLNELRGWRRWGTNQAREHLCEEVERLINSAADPLDIARQIKQARTTWKSLDGTEGAAPKVLWERFNGACERAYQACQTYFDTRARERQDNLENKQALCERLERFEATTDWDQVDWRAADRLQREAHHQWRKIGPVSHADKKALERRYHKIIKRLDERLAEERNRDLQRRQGLICQVQELANSEDLHAAIEAVKKAQAEWQPTVLSSRRKEQALWREFRSACDVLFERRQAQHRAADEERQANLTRKISLCEAMEALDLKDEAAIHRARNWVGQAQKAWESIGPVPKSAYKEIEHRFATAFQHFEQRYQQQQQVNRQQQLQSLRVKALLCSRLEALLYAQEPGDSVAIVDQTQAQWNSLSPLEVSLEAAIGQRFATACQAVIEGGKIRQTLMQALEENLEAKKRLCLRLEILARVDSPPEFAQARMEYQISRLSKSLLGRNSAPSEQEILYEARDIERQWYLAGAMPSPLDTILESRLERALAALHRHQDRALSSRFRRARK